MKPADVATIIIIIVYFLFVFQMWRETYGNKNKNIMIKMSKENSFGPGDLVSFAGRKEKTILIILEIEIYIDSRGDQQEGYLCLNPTNNKKYFLTISQIKLLD